MKALSIRQPWAWAIVHAGKDIENRSWSTSYRGPVLIHAAKGMTRDEYESFAGFYRMVTGSTCLPAPSALNFGGIIGRAEIVDCVRKHFSPWFFGPHGFVLANVGADRSADDARRAVDLLDADALQVHLNAAQELVMPEGSTRFDTWAASIAAICDAVDVPVVVKEVGAGLSGRTVARLRDLGVAVADVGGAGGTDFVKVENDRRDGRDFSYLGGWGLSTPACLLDAAHAGLPLLASGGIRNPLDVVRTLALGAHAAGVASRFLAVAVEGGEEALVAEMRRWLEHVAAILALVGAESPADAVHADVLVRGRLRELAELRGIDVTTHARRRAADGGSR